MANTVSDQFILGLLVARVDFWTHRYEFSFQIWGEHGYNVYINRQDVELTSFGENSMKDALEHILEWCEKANPRIKYPDHLQGNIDLDN